MKKILTSAICVVCVLSSCPTDVASTAGPSGSLTINLPLIGMHDPKNADPGEVYSYELHGAGPGGASFQTGGVTAQTVTIDSLAPGDWELGVDGENASNKVISSASMHVTVVGGSTVSIQIAEAQFLSGGSLSISLAWLTGLKETLSGVVLAPADGSPTSLALPAPSVAGGVNTITSTIAVAPGYYTLSRVFEDPTGFHSGGADALRVLPGDRTSFTLTVGMSGPVVTITPDTSKTIVIAFSGAKATYGKGQDVTVTAAPGGKESGSFTFQWYLNGSLVSSQTGPTVDLSGLGAGVYRLDCIVASSGILSSSHVSFSVTDGVGGS